jgi:hypothetical protein
MYGKDTLTLRDRFEIFKQHKDQIKADFEEFITSSAHPLEIRWQMFKDAPADLSNHLESIYGGLDEILVPGLGSRDINWPDEIINAERHQRINLIGEVEEIFSKPKAYRVKYPTAYEEGFLDKIKEQILKDNIKSFIYDW